MLLSSICAFLSGVHLVWFKSWLVWVIGLYVFAWLGQGGDLVAKTEVHGNLYKQRSVKKSWTLYNTLGRCTCQEDINKTCKTKKKLTLFITS